MQVKRSSPFSLLIIILGIIGLISLYYLYRSEGSLLLKKESEYRGRIYGPLDGRIRFINIIPQGGVDCLPYGFYVYFEGVDNEDFVIVTDSVRSTFGDMSENFIGYRFHFDRLMECGKRIEGRRTFLVVSPPVMVKDED